MCEYCGCQSIPSIELLTAEHDAALDYVRAAELAAAASDLEAAEAACAALGAVLEPHTAVEEEALFPAMAAEFGGHIDKLLAEHVVVHAAITELLADGPPAGGWPGRLTAAMRVLRGHILREQDGVFPGALAILGPQDWDRLDDVRFRVGSSVTTPSRRYGAADG